MLHTYYIFEFPNGIVNEVDIPQSFAAAIENCEAVIFVGDEIEENLSPMIRSSKKKISLSSKMSQPTQAFSKKFTSNAGKITTLLRGLQVNGVDFAPYMGAASAKSLMRVDILNQLVSNCKGKKFKNIALVCQSRDMPIIEAAKVVGFDKAGLQSTHICITQDDATPVNLNVFPAPAPVDFAVVSLPREEQIQSKVSDAVLKQIPKHIDCLALSSEESIPALKEIILKDYPDLKSLHVFSAKPLPWDIFENSPYSVTFSVQDQTFLKASSHHVTYLSDCISGLINPIGRFLVSSKADKMLNLETSKVFDNEVRNCLMTFDIITRLLKNKPKVLILPKQSCPISMQFRYMAQAKYDRTIAIKTYA